MPKDQFQKLFAELAKQRRQADRSDRVIRSLGDRMDSSLSAVRQEIAETRNELRFELLGQFARSWEEVREDLRREAAKTRDEFRAELREKLDATRDELRQEIGQTRTELRQDMVQWRDELRRHSEVIAEGLRGEIQIVAEGLLSLGEQVDTGRRETAAELAEIKALIRVSYTDLDRRVTRLEGAVGI